MGPPSTGPAPILLRGATVLTLDAKAKVLADADLLVESGRIAAIGPELAASDGTRTLDLSGCLLLPGLIQAHVHLGQTFFRGLAEGRRLLPWLEQRIWPLEAAHDNDSAYWCSLLGAAECLLGGTTTIQDIGLGPGARGLLQGIVDARLRAFAGQCLMDETELMPPRLAAGTEQVLKQTEDLGRQFDGAGGGRLRYALNPRFILSCSDDLWRGVRELAEKRGWPVHTHALEQEEESARVEELKGRDEIDYFAEYGLLDGDLRIAHGVGLTSLHRQRLSGRRFSVAHCPSSNLKLGSGMADVVALLESGIAVGIGCDGSPCNNDLDALEELRLAALLQQLRHGPDAFSGLDALRLATSDAARALGLETEIGSLEVGKAADLLVLERSRPELWQLAEVDLHDLVAFSASRASVRHVLVAGELLVEDGRLNHLDLDVIRRGAEEACERLLKRAVLPAP